MGICGFERRELGCFLRLGGGDGEFPAGCRQRLRPSLPPWPRNLFGLCRLRKGHMQATVKHCVDTRMSQGIGRAYLLVRS